MSDYLSYKSAGVDIDAGSSLIKRIAPILNRTRRPEIIDDVGGFAACSELPADVRNPVLVTATDGVGTKLRLAIQHGQLETAGIDLVAMCANDVLACGGEPFLFLDYFASGRLELDVAEAVIRGIANGCEQAGCALVGGETAEMPGFYHNGDFDIAGFCLGIAERDALPGARNVGNGSILIALPSSGPHANGYSLIRKIIEHKPDIASERLDSNHEVLSLLMQPTRIYSKLLLPLLRGGMLQALAHITGGGISENLPRILPAGTQAVLDKMQPLPAIFEWLRRNGPVTMEEMRRTFNCGIGMILSVAEHNTDEVLRILTERGETPWHLGYVRSISGDQMPKVLYK